MDLVKNNSTYVLYNKGNKHVYHYKNIDISTEHLATLNKVMGSNFISSHLLKPESLKIGDHCEVQYKIDKSGIYLFESLYEVKGNYIIGGAETILNFSRKANIIKQLCEAFQELNDKDIDIKKIDGKSLLYDLKLNHLFVDLLNVSTLDKEKSRFSITHTAVSKSIQEKQKRTFGLRPKSKQTTEITNNTFLGFLIYKILFNLSWFNDISLKEIEDALSSNESGLIKTLFSENRFENIITDDFYHDLLLLLKNQDPKNVLHQSPDNYLKLLDERKCSCKSGYFHEVDGQMYCDECQSTRRGIVIFSNTGKHIPLLFPKIIDLADEFELLKEKLVIRTASRDNVHGIFIPINDNQIKLLDHNGYDVELETNSKGDHYKIILETSTNFERTVQLNGEYYFTFRYL